MSAALEYVCSTVRSPLLKKFLELVAGWKGLPGYFVSSGESTTGESTTGESIPEEYIKIESRAGDRYLGYRPNLTLVVKVWQSSLVCTLYTYTHHVFKEVVIKELETPVMETDCLFQELETPVMEVEPLLRELERDKYNVCSGAFSEEDVSEDFERNELLKKSFIEKFNKSIIYRSRHCSVLIKSDSDTGASSGTGASSHNNGTGVCNRCNQLKKEFSTSHRKSGKDDIPDDLMDPLTENEETSQFSNSGLVGVSKWVEKTGITTNTRKFVCDICEASLKTKICLKRHRLHQHSLATCKLCNTQVKDLYYHNQTVHGKEEHKCDCGKSYTTKKALNLHAKHDHDTRHKQICQYCAVQVKNISHHIKLKHSGLVLKSVKCPHQDCTRQFRTKQDAKVHFNTFHLEKKEQCSLCNGLFKNLRDHVNQTHNNPGNHPCSQCGKRFRKKNDLKLHVERVHQTKRYLCPICGKKLSKVRDHLRLVHNSTTVDMSTIQVAKDGEVVGGEAAVGKAVLSEAVVDKAVVVEAVVGEATISEAATGEASIGEAAIEEVEKPSTLTVKADTGAEL